MAEKTTARGIASVWWPLAGSWLLMGLEMPAFVAAASRLPETKANLAAFSSVVYPISMVVEGPIVMLLAASTALVKDQASYRALRRFTILAAVALTLVHALIAFTPIYDHIALQWIQLAPNALEAGRIGLQIMLPWSAAIAYRRFQQGVLIRNGHSRAVVVGTTVRLLTNASVLVAGVSYGKISGVIVGASAIAAGVIAEAVYADWRTRRVYKQELPEREDDPLTAEAFTRFYLPLALTPFITLAMQPITAAAIWRLPVAYTSSASWSSVYGFIFLFRALGFAFQEVTVSLSRHPDNAPALRRFALGLATAASLTLLVVAWTPLGSLWFDAVLGLPPQLSALATGSLALGVFLPALAVMQNFMQGRLVHAHRTRGITEAVAIYLATACTGFLVAIQLQDGPGLRSAIVVLTIAGAAQLGWLWFRCRRAGV